MNGLKLTLCYILGLIVGSLVASSWWLVGTYGALLPTGQLAPIVAPAALATVGLVISLIVSIAENWPA